MSILIFGMAVFFGLHLMRPVAPALRSHLVRAVGGEARYRPCFAMAAMTGLALMIWGKVIAGNTPLWQVPSWGATVAVWMMLASIILFASQMGSNIQSFVRHPMLLGVALWAAAHLLANGDLESLLFFGAFLTYALFAMINLSTRGTTMTKRKWSLTRDIASVAAGIVVFGVLAILHPYLFGVAAF